ncbi:MAG: right-handed parallel beta-helix repeat-containing protein [Candidatus Heimdallarchaeota archaeon]
MKKSWKIFIGIMIGVVLTTSLTVPFILLFTQTIDVDNQIVITNDRMFKRYGFPGSGTESDPYIIENYILNTEWYAIEIHDTTKFFIIRNCSIQTDWSSFLIQNVKSGTVMITNSTFYSKNGSSGGISYSPYSSVINNTFIDCSIHIGGSANSKIVNNTISSSGLNGISLVNSPKSIISGNICYNDISTSFSPESFIFNNIFYNCGLLLWEYKDDYTKFTIFNNTVNGKKLGFVVNNSVTEFHPSIYGQLFLINCSDLVISNLIFTHSSIGLSIISCDNITLTNNICMNNTKQGIYLQFSSSITLINNTAIFNEYGLSATSSSRITLINNTLCNNDARGASFDYTINVNVVNNTINDNYFGVLLIDSTNSIIYSNIFTLNSDYAVRISAGVNNTIYQNNFIDNNLGGTSQGCDEGSDNSWYYSLISKGNYWSDWSSGNYTIDGTAGSMDIYPSDSPFII